MAESNSLPPAESGERRQSIAGVMGPEKFRQYMLETARRHEAAVARKALMALVAADEETPDFVRLVTRDFSDGPWGFAIVRGTAYEDDDVWKDFRRAFTDRLELAFTEQLEAAGVKEAKDNFTIQWIEDPSLQDADVETVARKYGGTHGSLPHGLAHMFCLSVTRQSLDSVMRPSTKHYAKIPFVQVVGCVGVDAEWDLDFKQFAEVEGQPYPARFKVAVDSLLSKLFSLVGDRGDDSIAVDEISGYVKEDETWTDDTSEVLIKVFP
ncbi:hypothetical protein F4677DRAFT_448687 [Hypoxylon crocopeplum]|nr:hypothetical protein F4677DRAFT_448687 [Hypoxylon crocopeplum]